MEVGKGETRDLKVVWIHVGELGCWQWVQGSGWKEC